MISDASGIFISSSICQELDFSLNLPYLQAGTDYICRQFPLPDSQKLLVLFSAGGLEFLWLSMILYAPGLFFYVKAAKEKNVPAFPDMLSKVAAVVVVVLGAVALYLVVTGDLKL